MFVGYEFDIEQYRHQIIQDQKKAAAANLATSHYLSKSRSASFDKVANTGVTTNMSTLIK